MARSGNKDIVATCHVQVKYDALVSTGMDLSRATVHPRMAGRLNLAERERERGKTNRGGGAGMSAGAAGRLTQTPQPRAPSDPCFLLPYIYIAGADLNLKALKFLPMIYDAKK